MVKYIYLFVLFVLFLPNFLSAKLVETDSVKALKINESIILDGKLSEPVWKNNPVKHFFQSDPSEGEPATEHTKVWVAYDDANLYIAARLNDSKPDMIDRSLVRRDNFVESDWFFFHVDPYNDETTGYFFGVNPGGSILDGTHFNDSFEDNSWDGIWEARSSVDQKGWTVEMRIPFSQLRFNESDEMCWGVNFQRHIKRNNERDFLIVVPKDESGFVSHFAKLEGLDGIETKQRFEFLPYVVQRAQYLQHDSGNPFYEGNQYATMIGGDFKVGIGSNMNLDVTINPDFGQAEVDPAVLNLSAFETYFQEKRSFFIEGANTFRFGRGGSTNSWGFGLPMPNLFYSRRIGRAPRGDVSDSDYENYPNETRILGAAKLTGNFDNSWSIGVVSALTERTYANLSLDGNQFEEEVEPFTHYGVVRSLKQFNGGKQALGVMLTAVNRDLRSGSLKESLSDRAYTFGVDGWTFLDDDETYVLTAAAVGSYTHGSKEYITELQKSPRRYMQRPDATYSVLDTNLTSLSGWFTKVTLNKQKGNFYVNAALGASSPGFDYNDLGWQFITDRITGHLVAGYRWFEPGEVFRTANVNLAYWKNYDFEGNVINNGFFTLNNFQFANYWGLHFRAGYNFDRLSRERTRGGPLTLQKSNIFLFLSANTDQRKKFILYPSFFFWRDKANTLSYELGFNVEWRPNTQLVVSVGPEYNFNRDNTQWIDSFDDEYAINTYNARYVFGELKQQTLAANIRVNWTFTPTLSLQLYVQPYFSIGKYENYKELAQPRTADYHTYGNEIGSINYNNENDEYIVDPDEEGPAEEYSFENPDFNFKSLRGNLVLRWEVNPGSILYFVWTHERTNDQNPGKFRFAQDFGNLLGETSDNVFLLKFAYWLDI